ncbi:Hypothetical predicted protein [Paramuricea clavata]|uniref:Uncharacterized protein n=1 Tax=Paramuricea clavata TaxID=317549 RepID=A0A7D9LZC0_PARCT|nr:Hypothetical predicted protein [Paramuricea clavata]
MPTDAWYLYKRSSADNGTVESLKQIGASPECTSDAQELQCVAVYCSEDEKYLLTEYTKADCENTTKRCLIDPIEALIKAVPFLETQLRPSIENLEETCAVYPADSNKQTPPPTVGTLRPGATVKIVKVGPTGSGATVKTVKVGPTGSGATVKTVKVGPTGSGATVKTVKVGPTDSGNIQLVDCVALLFSFIVVKLFA